jgi:hypothetical protein
LNTGDLDWLYFVIEKVGSSKDSNGVSVSKAQAQRQHPEALSAAAQPINGPGHPEIQPVAGRRAQDFTVMLFKLGRNFRN